MCKNVDKKVDKRCRKKGDKKVDTMIELIGQKNSKIINNGQKLDKR